MEETKIDLKDKEGNVLHPPPPSFDPALFEHDLKNSDMTEAQRIEALRILWNLMVACVDCGFGIEPTQAICRQLIKAAFEETQDSPGAPDVVELKKASPLALSGCFENVADKKEVPSDA